MTSAEPVTCSTCTRFTMGEHPGTTDEKSKRSAARMARMGMGRCLVGDHFRFLNPSRKHNCARYAQSKHHHDHQS